MTNGPHSPTRLVSPSRWLAVMLALTVAVALTSPAGAAETNPVPQAKGKPIDVVLCLDVSGSMNGLIDSAKRKLWDIVNDLGKAKPAPELRVGLYSYGHTTYDAKRGWVRKEADLTHDLDLIYQKLFALTINGGTELVARVCRDAVEEQKWAEDKSALRIIFVCGNESANQDKQVALQDVATQALSKSININTIYCGPVSSGDAVGWKDFARICDGQFASIDQNRAAVAQIATPHDKQIAELSAKLSTTYIAYGKEGKAKQENQLRQDANAAAAGIAVEAARGASKATALYRNEGWCLVDRTMREKDFDVKKVAVEDLPDNMKKMTPEQREAFVKDMVGKRKAMQDEITKLNTQRTQYIAEQVKKNPGKADQAFDEALRKTIREQAAKKGIEIPK